MVSFLLAIIYLAFISLGLPDAVLGSAWPVMHRELGVAVSGQGVIAMIISGGTILSSMMSGTLLRRFGTGRVTAASVGMTAAALLGFSGADAFWMLCLWAVPYGLGAGSVDTALNNFVALHYRAHHMNWLHCFWGIGAALGPYIMGYCLGIGRSWNQGYRAIASIQIVLTAGLLFSLPLWKKVETQRVDAEKQEKISVKRLLGLSGAKQILVAFFCYCSLEATTGLWGSSYFVMDRGIAPETAAKWASIFYLGITLGRFVCGFLSMRIPGKNMVRMGQILIIAGIFLILFPGGNVLLGAGYILIGLGCAPIYPALLHETPENFGKDVSQGIMGMEMACAYVGSTLMPPFFGLIAQYISIAWYPVYLLAIAFLMVVMTEYISRTLKRESLEEA